MIFNFLGQFPLDEQRCLIAYLDGLQARVSQARKLQSATGEELSALLPSVPVLSLPAARRLSKGWRGRFLASYRP
ncbi:MAG: hypothetical protein Q7U34_08215, partial [Anaerolineales bacterium]|nr:hypothetical protein [Anaerolineales bacterium]